MASPGKPHLVAVDTNILFRLAEENETAMDAIEVVRRLLNQTQFLVPPTAYLEMQIIATTGDDAGARETAMIALAEFRSEWRFLPAVLTQNQKELVIRATDILLEAGLLPTSERNDARIVAESAVLNCVLLVSNDSHLLEVDHRRVGLLFRELDLPVPIIASARDLVRLYKK